MKDEDVRVLALTLWAEARGEGLQGMIAAGWTIRNRVNIDLFNDGKEDWWGEGYVSVCKKPWQYSCWNKNDPNYPYLIGQKVIPPIQYELAKRAAVAVIEGTSADPTGGATHYYSTSMKIAPRWASAGIKTVQIGKHIFYKDVK
jgi:spore germination cell wall hydrolase CwlJ-like protein